MIFIYYNVYLQNVCLSTSYRLLNIMYYCLAAHQLSDLTINAASARKLVHPACLPSVSNKEVVCWGRGGSVEVDGKK